MEIINYRNALANTQEQWFSKTVGLVNNNTIRIRTMNKATEKWHRHDSGDELLMVLEGEVFIENSWLLKEKEFLVIPAGTQHRARSEENSKLLAIDNFK